MPAPSLLDSATKACIKNVRSLTDVGDFEYWKIRTVLLRLESPEQLHQIELNSPQIKGEDAELWQAFIARDIPNWQSKNYVPKNPIKWYEVYCKYKKEQRIELERDEAILKASLAELNRKKATNVSKIVELKTLPKLPRDPRMIANNGGVPLKGKGWAKPGASSLSWNLGSKTKMTDGQSVLTRARREAKEISARSKLAKPTHQLHGRVGQVKKAPAGMVNQYRRAAEQPVKILSSKKRNVVAKFEGGISGPSLEEREKRLRALTMSGASSRGSTSGAAPATFVGSSDDDEDDANSTEDLFDETPVSQARSTASSSSRPVSSLPSYASRPAPQATSRPRQNLSSSPPASSSRPAPNPRPSDMISSIISKPRAKTTPRQSPPPHPTSQAAFSRSPSPARGERKPMLAMKKRPPVDVFNRGASKRPRVR